MERDKSSDFSKEQLPSKPRLLGNTALTPIEIKDGGLFIDKIGLQQEQERLSGEISIAQEAIICISGRTSRDMNTWVSLEQKCDAIQEFRAFLANESLQIFDNPTGHTLAEISKLHLWDFASLLLFRSTLSKLHTIAKKDSIGDKYSHLSQLLSFDIAPELSIRVGQVSIQDFLSFSAKTTATAPFYQYLVESQQIRINNTHEQVLAQNQEYPKNMYPNLTKQAIDLLPGKVFALTSVSMPSGTLSKNAVETNPIIREAVKHRNHLIGKAQDVRTEAYKSLINSTSKDFLELSQLVQRYLESGESILKLIALNMILSDKKHLIIEMYRKARKHETNHNSVQFYKILADSIVEYIDEASSLNTLTDDDVATVLDTTDSIQLGEEKSEPTFEELGKKVNEIFNKTSRREFDIEIDDINWAQLQVPEGAQVQFDPNRPRKFTINITFNNELGESTKVEYSLDTTKNIMDWNHPEDPMLLRDDPDLRALRRSLLVAAQSILDSVYKQAEDEYQLKRQPKDSTSPAGVVQRPKRERAQDPVYQLRKDTRAQQREESIDKGSLFEVLSQKEEIKNSVILPSDEELEDMSRYLSHVDREIVRKSINEYNEKGTGAKFARKKASGPEGKPFFGLSIGCTVPKGARVLLRETDPGDGVRNFEIVDIRYRKDIYSKHKL